MTKSLYYLRQNKNSRIVLFAFLATILFQITAYKFIWGVEVLSRIVNLIVLIFFSGYGFYTLATLKFNKNIFYFYVVPGLFVYIGMFFNTANSAIGNSNVLNQFGLLLPWAIYLAVPALLKSGKLNVYSLWRYFYYFILATILTGILEYFLIFSDFIKPRPIVTSGGQFLAGSFSMLYAIETGELHYRFYASFMEPGTLAMFLLPAMAYAFLHRKYISLSIFVTGLILSDSLGGFIGAAMLVPILAYYGGSNKSRVASLIAAFASMFLMVALFYGNFSESYENKQNSRIVREENLSGTFTNLQASILNYPMGFPLTESTELAQQNILYSGSNFSPGNAFMQGGIFAFLGYITVLIASLWYALTMAFRKGLSIDEQVTVVSIFCLMPFIFQRTVVWDSSIFALLFAPFIIGFLQGTPKKTLSRSTQPDMGAGQLTKRLIKPAGRSTYCTGDSLGLDKV